MMTISDNGGISLIKTTNRNGAQSMPKLKMLIPKGRLHKSIVKLLNDSGFDIEQDERTYFPRLNDPEIEAKLMKPQNIPKIVELGLHDVGFCGHDWITETSADVLEIMDLKFDPVRIVAAAAEPFPPNRTTRGKIVVASEYENLSCRYLAERKFAYVFLRTFGATEAFPPDDADMIVDNVATGRTLKEHNLRIIDTLLESSTRFIANKKSMRDPWKKEKIAGMKMLFQSVLDAANHVMLEMNIPQDKFESIIGNLPCMRTPTIAPLYNNKGYAVKIAVTKSESCQWIPKLKAMGAEDILEYQFSKVVV
jgi:ATP phosphoribosyltransferase